MLVYRGEVHMALCLALDMRAEQDTAIFLRSRRRRQTWPLCKLGRRACREAVD